MQPFLVTADLLAKKYKGRQSGNYVWNLLSEDQRLPFIGFRRQCLLEHSRGLFGKRDGKVTCTVG
jgi:hypothetical protein